MKLSRRILIILLPLLLLALPARADGEERSFIVINAANGLADNSAQIVKCTRTGRLIISTIGNLNFFDGKSFAHANFEPDNAYRLPHYTGHYHLYFDKMNHIWLKDKGMVTCLDLMTERFIQNVDSVIRSTGCNDLVADMFVDQNGNIWYVTDKGLYSVKHGRYFGLQHDRNLQDMEVIDETLYMFYGNGEVIGVDSLDNIVCQLKAYDESLESKYDKTTVVQPYGKGFFQIRNGTVGSILLYFDTESKTYQIIKELDYHLNNLVPDESGEHLYIPCEYGYWVYTLATGEMVQYPELEMVSGEKVATDCNTIAFDHQGGMWIGTEKRGVFYAHPHSLSFRSYPWGHELATKYGIMMDSLQQNVTEYKGRRANCKYTDSRGWTWYGTRLGLYLEQPGVPEPILFEEKDGLNNEVIHAILEDRDHNIWVSTSCGITFLLVRDGKVVFVNSFTSHDNVPNESFENCKAILLPDGSIAMQAVDHVVLFNPEELRDVNEPAMVNNIKPKLIRLLVNGNIIEPGVAYDGNVIIDRTYSRVKHIYLNSDQNSISLAFSALNYFRPLQTFYRVKVYEKGNDWQVFSCYGSSNVDDLGILHYPMANLEPGDYHVEVQTSMFPDVWDEDSPDLIHFVWEVHVKQPWWRASGLYVLLGAVLLVLLLVNFYYYNRNTRMRDRRNNEEGDMIRKIRFFVERCEEYAEHPIAPVYNAHQMGGGVVASEDKLSPEFIEVMQKLIPYVRSHKHRTVTMRQLSDVGGMNVAQLYEVVMSNLHKSPRELTLLIKLRKCAEDLCSTNKSVELIAMDHGFSSPNFFMGSFFHQYKQLPEEYRSANS